MRFHDDVAKIQEAVDDLREIAFLRYLREQSTDRPDGVVRVGDAGDALQIPYEEAIRLANQLGEDGFLRRVDGYRSPRGPAVQITQSGLRAACT